MLTPLPRLNRSEPAFLCNPAPSIFSTPAMASVAPLVVQVRGCAFTPECYSVTASIRSEQILLDLFYKSYPEPKNTTSSTLVGANCPRLCYCNGFVVHLLPCFCSCSSVAPGTILRALKTARVTASSDPPVSPTLPERKSKGCTGPQTSPTHPALFPPATWSGCFSERPDPALPWKPVALPLLGLKLLQISTQSALQLLKLVSKSYLRKGHLQRLCLKGNTASFSCSPLLYSHQMLDVVKNFTSLTFCILLQECVGPFSFVLFMLHLGALE